MRENVQTFREVLITGVQLQRDKDTQGSKNPVNWFGLHRWLSDLIYVNTEAKTQRAPERKKGSESASDSENDPPSSVGADAEQYELMQASYVAVGKDFHDQEDLIGSEYSKLQKLELVPERWPLARLSFSLQKCVDHLDRVLAGCWEVHATRVTPLNHYPPFSKWRNV